MNQLIPASALAALLLLIAPEASGARRCLSDAQIEAAVGDQIRAGVFALDTSALPNLPLCSAIPLAQRLHEMREAANPDERAAREQRQADQRVLQHRAAERSAAARLAAMQRAAELEEAERQASLAAARRDAAIANADARRATAGARAAELAAERGYGDGPLVPAGARAVAINGLAERLDRIVAEDATAWWGGNRYVARSMRAARAYADATVPGTFVAMGEFRYASGKNGWVRARFDGETLMCLEFNDEPGNCRALYDTVSKRTILGVGSWVAQIVIPMLPGLLARR